MLASVSAQTLQLSWQASTSSEVAGYNIYYGTASGVYTDEISVGNVDSVTVSNLVAGQTYFFVVTSQDADGIESDPSPEISYTIYTNAVLQMQTVQQNGTTMLNLTAAGPVPDQWVLESSPDLQNWSTYTTGSGASVNLQVPVGTAPQMFFRLRSQ